MDRRVLIFAVLAVSGCGGSAGVGGPGPGGPGGPTPVTIVIPTTPARSGYVRSGGLVIAPFLYAGDFDGSDLGIAGRAVVGFDLAGSGIPPGATIQTATLALFQGGTSTGTPYADLGNLLADHVDIGAALDATDYGGGTLAGGFGIFSTDGAFVVKSLEVGAQVQADLTAGRAFSDFRLRFALDRNSDFSDDFMQFNDVANSFGAGPAPTLTVAYLP